MKRTNFLRALDLESAQEALDFIKLIERHKDNFEDLKLKLDWYIEQYIQMLDNGNDNFRTHIVNESYRQIDEFEAMNQN